MQKRKKGFTLIEVLASIVILSFVFISAVTIFLSVRTQTVATQNRFEAVEAGTQIRDVFTENTTYALLELWLDSQIGDEIILNKDNCDSDLFNCDALFNVNVNGKVFDNYNIVFTLINDYKAYQVIHFRIDIPYYENRIVSLRGIVYETEA